MDKHITSGAVGGQTKLQGNHLDKTLSQARTDRAALGPEEAETIRGFAEHIVRLLCARHNLTLQDTSEKKSDFSLAAN